MITELALFKLAICAEFFGPFVTAGSAASAVYVALNKTGVAAWITRISAGAATAYATATAARLTYHVLHYGPLPSIM